MINDFELGWIVGYLEGEGSFEYRRRAGKGGSRAVRVRSTDLDVINKFIALMYKLTGKQYSYCTTVATRENWSDSYLVQIYSREALQLMKLIVPHMGYRRRQRIWQSINGFEPPHKFNIKEIMKLIAKDLHCG